MHKGSDVGLFTLARHLDDVPEADAQFYSRRIICGPQRLHTIRIVHMDLKPENIPLLDSNYALVAEFDRSYDLREDKTSRNARLPHNYPISGTQKQLMG